MVTGTPVDVSDSIVRILIPFWLGVPDRCFYQEFMTGVTEALRELGHEPSYFPFNDAGKVTRDEAGSLYRQVDRNRPDVLLDLACWGCALSRVTVPRPGDEQVPIFAAYDIPYAAVLLDQPFNQALGSICASRLHAVYPDLGHPSQVRLMQPGLKLSGEIFAPPAVRPANDRSGREGRPIDVLYVGNLDVGATERFWHDRVHRRFPVGFDAEFCDAVVEAVVAEPERSLHVSVDEVLRRTPRPPSFDLGMHWRCVELFLRHVFRRDAVLALAQAGLRIHVVGKDWRRLALPPDVELQEPTDYEGIFRLAGAAKICLDASTYLDGANDRVFSYAVNRALCFTNAAGYLRSALGEDRGLRFYSFRRLSQLVQEIQEWLARPEPLREMGERAHASVLAAHTWRHRLEHILGAIVL
jgi:hypothetical protein